MLSPEVDAELERHSATAGVDANVLRKFVRNESGGNPNAKASTSSARGLFQFINSTWNDLAARYSHLELTDRNDPVQQARIAPYYLKEIKEHAKARLKRDLTEGEQYLGWFLGPVGLTTAAGYGKDAAIVNAIDPRSRAANGAVFSKMATVADLWAWGDRKMGGAALSPLPESSPSLSKKMTAQGMSMDPIGMKNPTPFTDQDEYNARVAKETNSYSLVQAAAESAKLDWSLTNLLSAHGKNPYDPSWVVSIDALKKDERASSLPSNYLSYLAQSSSEQDYEFRLAQSVRDFEVEQKLANTNYGVGIRMAVGMADPLGLLLSAASPFSLMARVGQAGKLARFGATAADGALGNVLAEAPLMMNKPGYEMEQMLWAASLGAGAYVGLNRSWAKDPDIAPDVKRFEEATARIQRGIESGTFGSASAGAAQNIMREAVIGDIEDWSKIVAPKSGRAWMDWVRFDAAKLKNSQNPAVAAIMDRLGVDAIGNRDKTKAITRAIEEDKRLYEHRANIVWSRNYEVQSEKYRERNKIGMVEWKNGAEDAFQRKITHAKRNTDPGVTFDPEVENMATTWKTMDAYWREHARNPGKLSGETMRPISGADSWVDDPNYVPRFVNWDKWLELTSEFGDLQIKRLLGESISAKNPDLDPELAHKIGGWYYKKIRDVEAGQEMTASRTFSGLDIERMRTSLIEELGLSENEVGKVLFQATARDEGKGITNRQKMRQQMDENFSLTLNGKNGARQVSISEIWEDNARAVIHAYNHQMSGAVAMARFRIENPNWKVKKPKVDKNYKATGEFEEVEVGERWLVDGIHKDADWADLLKKVRALDNHIRPEDRGQAVEAEIRNLQWIYESIVGIPNGFERTKWGQYARLVQGINFARLMQQAGFASVAELGMVTASTGWKHTLRSVPGIAEFKRNALDGKLLRDELEDWEYIFTIGTDHLRGTGMNMRSNNYTTGQIEPNMSRKIEKAERAVGLAGRATSMISLAPITTFEERLALKAAIGKFREAANKDGKGLREQRMRLLGIDPDMQKRILSEIKKHTTKITSPEGREVEILGLDKWDEQVRSTFELAINRHVRRMIQQNDLGQMNHVLGHPVAKIFTQFRSFSLAAWSKNTLANIHMRDWESVHSFMASSAFGGMAYVTQTYLNSLGLPENERREFLEERLSEKKLGGALFQRTGFSSIIPGMADFGLGIMGLDPLFDTRSTGQPTQGLAGANPTFGLIDGAYRAVREGAQTVTKGDAYTADDFRKLSGAINPFHKYPIILQMMNLTSGAFPEE